jgi:hypothetical protein
MMICFALAEVKQLQLSRKAEIAERKKNGKKISRNHVNSIFFFHLILGN